MTYHNLPVPQAYENKLCISVQGVKYPVCFYDRNENDLTQETSFNDVIDSFNFSIKVIARTGELHGWRLKSLKS